jgi:hypothetical protein
MKFTQKTVQVLKHFSSINQSIVIRKGDVVSTTSELYTILAKTKVDQTFDTMIPIYDLNRFLGALSLFSEPEIVCHEKYMTIRSADKELVYLFADPKTIKQPPAGFSLPEPIVTLKLTASTLSDIMKALSIMSLPEIAFVGDGETVSVQALDTKNPTSDNFKIGNLGATDKKFMAIFRVENMKIIPSDYELSICPKVSYFKGNDIEYWIAVEKDSKF